jgi:hypothetical protein
MVETPLVPEFKPISWPLRVALIAGGSVAFALGVIGAILPGMPSTVFFIIALACYARSSDRMYRWVNTRPWLQGSLVMVHRFNREKSLPIQIKAIALSASFISLGSVFLLNGIGVPFWITAAFALSCVIAMTVIKTQR